MRYSQRTTIRLVVLASLSACCFGCGPQSHTSPAIANRTKPAASPDAATSPGPRAISLSLPDCLRRTLLNHPGLVAEEVSASRSGEAGVSEGNADTASSIVIRAPRGDWDGNTRDEHSLRDRVNHAMYETIIAYWDYTVKRMKYDVRKAMLDRALARAQRVERRMGMDASAREVLFTAALVEVRRSELSYARQQVEAAEDNLKLIMNDPELGVGTETEIIPTTSLAVEMVSVDTGDQRLAALRARYRPRDGESQNMSRRRAQTIALQVEDACRQLRTAYECMEHESKSIEQFSSYIDALRDMGRIRYVLDVEYWNQMALVEEHLAAARFRLLDATASINEALARLDLATRSLHGLGALRIRLLN